jgi:hypothetical protein
MNKGKKTAPNSLTPATPIGRSVAEDEQDIRDMLHEEDPGRAWLQAFPDSGTETDIQVRLTVNMDAAKWSALAHYARRMSLDIDEAASRVMRNATEDIATELQIQRGMKQGKAVGK